MLVLYSHDSLVDDNRKMHITKQYDLYEINSDDLFPTVFGGYRIVDSKSNIARKYVFAFDSKAYASQAFKDLNARGVINLSDGKYGHCRVFKETVVDDAIVKRMNQDDFDDLLAQYEFLGDVSNRFEVSDFIKGLIYSNSEFVDTYMKGLAVNYV